MQKVTYYILFALLLPFWSVAQGTIWPLASSNTVMEIHDPQKVTPVTLLPPIFIQNEQALLFQWQPIASANYVQVEYEFVVKDNENTIFTLKTNAHQIRLGGKDYLSLKPYKNYQAFVHTKITEKDYAYVMYGDETGTVFKVEPDCRPPYNVQVNERGDQFIVVGWEGVPAIAGSVGYKVRYKPEKGQDTWKEQPVTVGKELMIDGLESGMKYELEVQKICYWQDGTPILSEWAKAEASVASKITLPFFNCGDAHQYPQINCDSANLVSDPNHNVSLLDIGGFPLEVSFATSDTFYGSNNIRMWSGEGLVPLPFGVDKYVSVEFLNVFITKDNKICNSFEGGGVFAISDVPPNLPDLTPDSNFIAQICLPPPSEEKFDSSGIHSVTGLRWDPYGFGPDSLYTKKPPYNGYQPGFPIDSTGKYDPNGFDASGINALTGTIYNPQGCNRDGLDSLNKLCNPAIPPYSWMNPSNSSPPTQAGLAFAGQIKDSLSDIIFRILGTLNIANSALMLAKDVQCENIRTAMTTNVSSAGISAAFLFGTDNEYFEKGMHLNFSAAPQPMASGSIRPELRNSAVKSLEAQHIELYQCDKDYYVYVYLREIIEAFMTTELPSLTEDMLEKIKRQPQNMIDKFVLDHNFFLIWLRDQVNNEIRYQYIEEHGASTTAIEPVNKGEYDGFDAQWSNNQLNTHRNSPSGYLAANDINPELLFQAATVRLEDIQFEYTQGFRVINGVHRAFYQEAIVAERNAFGTLTTANPTYQPIDIMNIGADGRGYRVYLDNMRFYADQPATLDATIVLDLPFNGGQRIVFEALNMKFTPKGFEAQEGIKLELSHDIPIKISNNARMMLKGVKNTFVAVNCKGFAGMGIEADLEICRNLVQPIDPVTEKILPDPRMVHGHFIALVPDLTSLYIQVKVDPFVVTGAEEVKWFIDTITFDLSEAMSPTGTPPVGYNTQLAGPSGFRPLWKGFYAKSIEVSMPRKFRKDHAPVSLGVQNLLIDPMGVSCAVYASNLLPLGQGNADGWPLSLDKIEVTILMSNISKAEFNGKIHVPLFRDSTNTSDTLLPQDCFNYIASIKPKGLYQFSVTQQEGTVYAADIWKASSVAINASSINIDYQNDSFHIVARLSGGISINNKLTANVKVNIPPLSFQDLEISNRAPYFSPGTWGFPTKIGAKFAGFELGFKNIMMVKTENYEPMLNFDASLQITDDTTKIKATFGFGIVGKMEEVNGEQRWKYKRLKVKDVDINGSFPGVEYVRGFAKFFEGDSIFGTGFRGGLNAKFKMLGEIAVVGQFGRMPTYKYFMIDALYCADPGSGVNIAGAFELRGAGGGAYYHMRRPDHALSFGGCGTPVSTVLGTSLSGIVYEPTDTVKLGIKLTLVAATTGIDEAFNMNVTLEFQFGDAGGLDKVWLYGNAKLMAPMELSGLPTFVRNALPNTNAALKANVDIVVDFEKNTLDGLLESYMNIAGVLRGGDPTVTDRVCFAKIFVASENNWYIKLGGTGEEGSLPRMSLIAVVPGMSEPLFTFSAYLQIGHNLDPLPPLPAEIVDLFNTNIPEGYERSPDMIQGNGFVFGVDVTMGGGFNFLALYADIRARIGFDLGIIKSNIPMLCNGHEFGVNGWYASGQMYAALTVDMGLRVKIYGQQKSFSVFSGQAAAALEARLPNPFWARGSAAYKYSFLNGLVTDDGGFDFEFGESCQFSQQGSVADVPIILDMKPSHSSNNNPVGMSPLATFNFAVGQDFTFEELTGNSTTSFRVVLDTAQLYWRGYTMPISTVTWSTDKKKMWVKPLNFLPGMDTIRFLVSVHVDSNGITINRERKDIWFVTGAGMRTIPEYNVKGSYPLNGQYNFYRNELTNNKGYIQLDRGQPDLFIGESEYIKVARFRKKSGECTFAKLNFTAEQFWDKKMEFPLPPSGFLQSGNVYEMQIVDYPKSDPTWGADYSGAAPCICNGCITVPPPPPPPPYGGLLTNTLASIDDGPIPPPTPAPTPGNGLPTERIVYSAYFRVSQYANFAEKMSALEGGLPKPPKPGSTPDDQVFFGTDKTFDVPITIEPFDWCDRRSMGVDIPMTDAYLPPQSNPHWTWGVPSKYLFPFYYPNKNYTDAGGTITTGPLLYKANKAIYFSFANTTDLRVEKTHWITGLPSNFAAAQKMTVYPVKTLVLGAQTFLNSIGAYEASSLTDLREHLYCSNNPYMPTCTCSDNNPFAVDYSQYLDLKCTVINNNSVVFGTKSYPIKFNYNLPGIAQNTGDYFIYLNH